MKIMTKTIIALCIFCVSVTPVWANTPLSAPVGKVTEINLGERAPFKGVLFSEDAAAALFANLKLTDTECRLRLKKELDINSAVFNSQIEALNLRLSIETKRANDILQIKNERIQFLEENWQPTPWYESGEFWLSIGVLSGILITVGAGYAIGQAGK